MRFIKRNYDWALFALIAAAFVFFSAQRLGTVPLPDRADEAFTLQVAYEMVHHGKLALPMYRYMGGNIENVWHSYTPVFFLLFTGFLKIFGFGLLEARAFNLITVLATLFMTFLIGRRFFNWRVGLLAVAFMITDPVLLERTRLLRHDFAASSFAMLGLFLYEVAEQRKRVWLFACSGLAVGIGIMCHSNILYMLTAICCLMLIRHGRRLLSTAKLPIFLVSAFAVMAYEIIYIVIDYRNFVLQNRDDKVHFNILNAGGWFENLVAEAKRYYQWYEGGSLLADLPKTLFTLFLCLSVIGLVYLIVHVAKGFRRNGAALDLRLSILVVAIVSMLFHALVVSHKTKNYLAHLAPWFALSAGILIDDLAVFLARFSSSRWRGRRVARYAVAGLVTLCLVAYTNELFAFGKQYLKTVRYPYRSSFEEFKSVLRSIVPDGVCPVAIRLPTVWLAFPEADYCFATIETRMRSAVDLKGKEYALVIHTDQERYWSTELEGLKLIGSMLGTPYGDLSIYYTGLNEAIASRAPQTYRFFSQQRGYVSDDELARAREIWSASGREMGAHTGVPLPADDLLMLDSERLGSTGNSIVELASIDLEPNTIYKLDFDIATADGQWELIVYSHDTGEWLNQTRITAKQKVENFVLTFGTSRIKLLIRPLEPARPSSIRISGARVFEVKRL